MKVLVAGDGFKSSIEPVLRVRILVLLQVNGPLSLREICSELNMRDDHRVGFIIKRLWKKRLVLRTKQPVFLCERVLRGRSGGVNHVRAVNYYAFNDGKLGYEFVFWEDKIKDGRDKDVESKASRILRFLEENKDKAFYSTDIRKVLKVKPCDIMPNVRRFEKKGLVFVRGYQSHDKRSPFRKGYVISWIEQSKPRETAVKEAFDRTNNVIVGESSSNTVLERVRIIRDQLVVAKDLLSVKYFHDVLNCSKDQVRRALRRAMQLYSDTKVVKVFNNYPYYYLDSMDKTHFKACLELKRNYIRKTKGRDNRLGHNWEAVCEWFIEKFTKGVHFWTQNHRDKMDPRRITLHLLKGVGKRRMNAEVDRVWEVTPGLFSPSVVYVLECKWSIVTKQTLDEFIDVLRWSTDFGTDTEKGREVKKGVIPVFGAGAFNPKGKAVVNGRRITLAQYTSRLNIQLLKPSDFNKKLREHGVEKKVTVQKICKICRDEKQIRQTLDRVWMASNKAIMILDNMLETNREIYNFEHMLTQKSP